MIEIKDIAGLSAPLTRLIEVISNGVGAVSSSYLVRKNAEAKAHEIRTISDALNDVADKHQLPVVYSSGTVEVWQTPEDKSLFVEQQTQDQRLSQRLNFQERKRQQNIEHVTSVAAIELSRESEVPDDRPDDDWITRFFDNAQAISSDQMQDLWGRVLAGEIKSPGAFSLKTLDFMRNINQSDAQVLETIGKVAIHRGDTSFISMHDANLYELRYGILEGTFFTAGELGLIYPSKLALQVFLDDLRKQELFFHGDLMLLVDRGDVERVIQVPSWKFTQIGRELLGLVVADQDDQLLESFGKYFMSKRGVASINHVIEKSSDGKVSYEHVKEVTLDGPT